MKHCKACDTSKPESEFHRLPHTSDGLNWRCIPCQNAYNREWNRKRAIAKCDARVLEVLANGPDRRVLRFAAKVEVLSSGCWRWHGNLHPDSGYGRVWFSKTDDRFVHRVAYEWAIGSIPEGLVLDHLCRNRWCVNPSHLEPVTNGENVLRGYSGSAVNARKQRCWRGHAFTPDNTYVAKSGARHCRECARLRKQARRDQQRARLASA